MIALKLRGNGWFLFGQMRIQIPNDQVLIDNDLGASDSFYSVKL